MGEKTYFNTFAFLQETLRFACETWSASQSAPHFSGQGTDQVVSHFKGCLNPKSLQGSET